jgi:cell division septum initiation protein DivIVA
METEKTSDEHFPARRKRLLPVIARKIKLDVAKLEETAQREEARNLADHERVRALANTATGGSFTKIMRSSPVLTDDDRAFLKELKYI